MAQNLPECALRAGGRWPLLQFRSDVSMRNPFSWLGVRGETSLKIQKEERKRWFWCLHWRPLFLDTNTQNHIFSDGEEVSLKNKKRIKTSILKALSHITHCKIFSRGRGARTPIYGFGDRCSTIELFPCITALLSLPHCSCSNILAQKNSSVNNKKQKCLKISNKFVETRERRAGMELKYGQIQRKCPLDKDNPRKTGWITGRIHKKTLQNCNGLHTMKIDLRTIPNMKTIF